MREKTPYSDFILQKLKDCIKVIEEGGYLSDSLTLKSKSVVTDYQIINEITFKVSLFEEGHTFK